MVRHVLRFAALAAFLSGLLSALPAAPAAAGDTPAETRLIRATLDSLNAACARRDSVAFMDLFDDGDRIFMVGSSTGEVYDGRDAVAGFRRMLFSLPFVFSFDLANVVIRSEGRSAWAYVDGHMIHTGASGRSSSRPYRFSLALVKRGSAWKWQLFHGSVPGAD